VITQLKKIRLAKGIQQVNLAKIIALPLRTLQQYEAGKRTPNAYTAQKLATALEVPVSEIFPLETSEAPSA
jgi:transcriptional regulator with XRE-family HTH domain